jgi:hypothetical protein
MLHLLLSASENLHMSNVSITKRERQVTPLEEYGVEINTTPHRLPEEASYTVDRCNPGSSVQIGMPLFVHPASEAFADKPM